MLLFTGLFFLLDHLHHNRFPDRLVVIGAETVDQCFLGTEITFFIDFSDSRLLHQFCGGRFAGDSPHFAVNVIDKLQEGGFKDVCFRWIIIVIMVLFHDLPDSFIEAPAAEQLCTGLRVIDLQNGIFQLVKRHFLAGIRVIFHQLVLLRRPVTEYIFTNIVQMCRADQFGIIDPVVIQNAFHKNPAGVRVIPFLNFPVAEAFQNVGNVRQSLDPVDRQHCRRIQRGCGVDPREGMVKEPEHLRKHHVVVSKAVGNGGQIHRFCFEDCGKLQHGAGGQGKGFQFFYPCHQQFLFQLRGFRYVFDQIVHVLFAPIS